MSLCRDVDLSFFLSFFLSLNIFATEAWDPITNESSFDRGPNNVCHSQ